MADLAALTAAVEAGDRAKAVELTQAAIDEGVPPDEILDAMTDAMSEVGRKFACNEGVYVPEMLISAHAMKEASALLEPLLAESGVTPDHTAVIGTVQGDLHDIGKNLVGMMLKGANFEIVDLGTNVAPDAFASAVTEHDADIVGISALLTTTMVGMKDAVAAVRAADPKVKIMVGGAPVTDEFAAEIGADGFAKDAATAANVAQELLAEVAGPGAERAGRGRNPPTSAGSNATCSRPGCLVSVASRSALTIRTATGPARCTSGPGASTSVATRLGLMYRPRPPAIDPASTATTTDT